MPQPTPSQNLPQGVQRMIQLFQSFQGMDAQQQEAYAIDAPSGCSYGLAECLRTICGGQGKVLPGKTIGDVRTDYIAAINTMNKPNSGFQTMSRLGDAQKTNLYHFLASELAPFFCQGPPPPTAVAIERPETLLVPATRRQPLLACTPARVTESNAGWWAAAGAVAVFLLTLPMRAEIKLLEIFYLNRPEDTPNRS